MKYKYNILEKKNLYSGFHELLEYRFNFSKFNGSISPDISRELFKRKPCVGLLPYDPIRDEIILIEQIRLGPLVNNDTPWILEIVAGIVEDYEDKDSTIIRESLEEANCQVKKLIPIFEYYMTPGYCNETIKLYCGITDTSQHQTGNLAGLEEEAEDIKIHVFKSKDAFKMLDDGMIINASTIVALQWLRLNLNNLK